MGKVKAFFAKLNNASPMQKASFWFIISNIALKGMSFITTPIFTRILDVSDYGITSVFVTWEGIISVFASLSLAGGVYNVAMTKYEGDIDNYTSSMLGLTALFSVATYSICIGINIIYPELFQLDNSFLLYMWLQTFTNAVITFWLMRKRFLYSYKPVIAYTFLNALLSPALAIAAVYLFPENKAYAKVIGAGIAGIVIGIIMLISYLHRSKQLYNKQYWKYALKFNLPLIPHYLSGAILHSSDKLMINNMVSHEAAGIYSIAQSITGVIGIVTQAINYSLIPYTLQSIKAKNTKGLSSIIVGCSVLVSSVCIGVMLFAKEGILIFATTDYLDALYFLLPLIFAAQFDFIAGILGNIIFYYEKTKFITIATLTCAAINIVANYFGIKTFGYIAAGYTTLICSALKLVLIYIFVYRCDRSINNIVNKKFLFLVFTLTAGFMIYARIFYDILWARLALAVLVIGSIIVFRKKIIGMFRKIREKDDADTETECEQAG